MGPGSVASARQDFTRANISGDPNVINVRNVRDNRQLGDATSAKMDEQQDRRRVHFETDYRLVA